MLLTVICTDDVQLSLDPRWEIQQVTRGWQTSSLEAASQLPCLTRGGQRSSQEAASQLPCSTRSWQTSSLEAASQLTCLSASLRPVLLHLMNSRGEATSLRGETPTSRRTGGARAELIDVNWIFIWPVHVYFYLSIHFYSAKSRTHAKCDFSLIEAKFCQTRRTHLFLLLYVVYMRNEISRKYSFVFRRICHILFYYMLSSSTHPCPILITLNQSNPVHPSLI